MYTLQQSNLVNDLHSRLVRGIEITELTPAEKEAVLEGNRHPDVRPKAQKIMRAVPSAFGGEA